MKYRKHWMFVAYGLLKIVCYVYACVCMHYLYNLKSAWDAFDIASILCRSYEKSTTISPQENVLIKAY